MTGNLQPVFFNGFIKEHAERLGIKGFVRQRVDGRAEIFIEGSINDVEKMTPICKRGPEHSLIRKVEEKDEYYQGFTDFKILKI